MKIDESNTLPQKKMIRQSKRTKITKSFGLDFIIFLIKIEPQSFRKTRSYLEAPQWKASVNSEIKLILQNHT